MASVADIIHQHRDEIMEHWRGDAMASASARGLSVTALQNIMPTFLSALADQVETGQDDATARRHEYVQAHLSSRLRQGFELSEILDEFLLIGKCVSRAWQHLPAAERPSSADVERLHAQLYVAIAEVTDAFYRHMLQDEQAEKRAHRMLQDIASQALHETSRPLRDRFADLLDVVMRAMNAECAAFLRYDAAEATLILQACSGAQRFEPYQAAVDSHSFVSEIMGSEEATQLRDVMATPLDIPAALRDAGVHALLGVRLPARNSLLGVMYVGIAESRELTAREIRRMESLGERVALHIENARLFAELEDKIASLDLETALRERFVSMLVHDLRGPLSAARLAAQLLAAEPDRSERRPDLASKIDRNLVRADMMIGDLLDASRIRAGEQLPLELERLELGAIAAEVAQDARAMYGERFVVDCEQSAQGVWSAEQLRRALWNLVTNAVKYGAPDEPIVISIGRHGECARLSVHNVGAPISEADQARIFDAYTRAPTAAAGGRIGWGLGLTLVRGVAEAHGGRVTVASDASGTTFTIELPFDARIARTDRDCNATIH